MAYDILIKNGTLVDGTGAPRVRADLAIAGDRIAEIGQISEGARRVIDASDLIVSPGFVDPHTHYDAQICWDPLISCTSWHGVTSVVMGNCGVGVAPCKPESREIAAWDLTNVEAIPYDSLNRGITWDWESFPEFLDAAQKRGAAINLGFLAPLTPFRHYVMGKESMERAATPEETEQIAALLGEAVGAGALGFSTTTLKQHIGFHGSPLACRLASRDELKAYANVLKQHGKGSIEVALTKKIAAEAIDFSMGYAGPNIIAVDAGEAIVNLAGVHAGCFELLGREGIRSIVDLKDKSIGITALGSSEHVYLAVMLAYIGLDPNRDVNWVTSASPPVSELFVGGKIDAFLGFAPTPQDLRARHVGHVVVNSAVDRPWSQYFCCMLIGYRDFVRKYPIATKRVLRAVLKAADYCASEPAAVARRLVDSGFSDRYDYAAQGLSELPYDKWREFDTEDTVRFYALRLRETGFVRSSPQKIIAEGTDWRFLNELKRELKA